MNTFKKKSLYAAVAGLSALATAGTAEAVNVNPDGLGQVLLYPYYTTRANAAGNAYSSLLTVVNSTATAKAVKVRFLEGKNSREVLDFNLFLSAYDVWTAAILPSTSGGAMVATTDRSCTLPWNQGLQVAPAGTGTGANFVNTLFDDGVDTSLDRTKEGYVELIEMGELVPGSATQTNITHINGVPKNCSAVDDTTASGNTIVPRGGLFGGMTLINVAAGTDLTEDAVALDHFHDSGPLYRNAGSIFPQLTDANPTRSVVFTGAGGAIVSDWLFGEDAVSAVLMHSNVLNEFVLDPGTKAGTDWIITMPTKRFYVFPELSNDVSTPAIPPFQRNFAPSTSTASAPGSCDDVTLNIFDREEFVAKPGFSPPPRGGGIKMCWEANVVTFNNSNVLGSTNVANINTQFTAGWLNIGFPTGIAGWDPLVHQLVPLASTVIPLTGATFPASARYVGLPTIGLAVETYTNSILPVGGQNVLSNYGGNFVHKYTTSIFTNPLLGAQ